MNNVLLSLAFLVSIATITSADAAEKPQVTVRFRIDARSYRDHYGTQLTSIQAVIEQELIAVLQNRIQFAGFSPAGSAVVPYTLTLTLAVRDPSLDDTLQSVDVYASLAGSAIATGKDPWPWFRYREPAMECRNLNCPLPARQDFIHEMRIGFSGASYPALVKNILSGVRISETGRFVAVPPLYGWEIPLRQIDVCLDKNSGLRISNDIAVPPPFPPHSGEFYSLVQGVSTSSPDSLITFLTSGQSEAEKQEEALLKQFSDKAVVKGVYVVDFHPLGIGCGGAISPSAAGHGGGL